MLTMLVTYMRALLGRNEEGQAMTEYALILALVAIALIAIIIMFRDQLHQVFDTLQSTLGANNTVPTT